MTCGYGKKNRERFTNRQIVCIWTQKNNLYRSWSATPIFQVRLLSLMYVKGGGWFHEMKIMGQEYLFLVMNELFCFEEILIFSEKNLLFCFLIFCLLIWNFFFLPLNYFIYFKRRGFLSGIVAKVYAGEKAHFPSFTKSFSHLQNFYV